jgi:hypothetical protein
VSVSNVALSKQVCSPGEYLNISFKVTNTSGGDAYAYYTITANGQILKSDITALIPAGGSITVTDVIQAPTTPGSYQVCVLVTLIGTGW